MQNRNGAYEIDDVHGDPHEYKLSAINTEEETTSHYQNVSGKPQITKTIKLEKKDTHMNGDLCADGHTGKP